MSKIDKEKPFIEHLEELRKRLIICIVAVFIGITLVYTQTPRILKHLVLPVGTLFFFAPTEAFVVRIKMAIWSGLYIALPVIFYQIWSFLEVGLRNQERKYVSLLTIFSMLLFTVGALFAYFLILPVGIKFLLSFRTETLQPMISMDKYISFVGNLLLGFGISFQLPIVSFILTKFGVISPKFLIAKHKYAILLIFIVAAGLTPGTDVFSQLLMAGPLLVLYEISILISKLAVSKKQEVRTPHAVSLP